MDNERVIDLSRLAIDDLDRLFRSDDRGLLEELAQTAQALTRRHFGRACAIYAPLYLSNYCENGCVYCGFHAGQTAVERRKLSNGEIEEECRALAASGIRDVLLLTGESRRVSPPAYLEESVSIAARYFTHVALEVYPLEQEEYRRLYLAGVDGVTMFQETYDRARYEELHPAGPKRDYRYRFEAPERMARAGIRHISMGALLGLADWREDATALFRHVRFLEKRFPAVEYTLSFPRLRPVAGDCGRYFEVSDRDMVKIICAGRLLFPRAGINLSTREAGEFRDRIIELGVTKMSAGSLTTVGGYGRARKAVDEGQFQVRDERSVAEITAMLARKGFDPVLTDWRHITNE